MVSIIEEALGGTSFHALDTGVDSTGEARLSFADIAVLYRTARQARPVMDALDRHGFPFQRRSHNRFADAPGVARLLELVGGHDADLSAHRRTVLARLRAAAQTAIDGAAEVTAAGSPGSPGSPNEAEIRYGLDILVPLATECGDDLERFRSEIALGAEVDTLDPRADRISLLTLHASKGLEFGLVVIIGCEDGLVPLRWAGASTSGSSVGSTSMSTSASGSASGSSPGGDTGWGDTGRDDTGRDDGGDDEERRLLFVGMTRAKERLVLTHAARRGRGGQVLEVRPSPFLDGLDAPLLQRRSGPAKSRSARAKEGRQLRLV